MPEINESLRSPFMGHSEQMLKWTNTDDTPLAIHAPMPVRVPNCDLHQKYRRRRLDNYVAFYFN